MNRIVAGLWSVTALFIGAMALKIAFGPKGDASGWVLACLFAAVAAFCARSAWKDWSTPETAISGSPRSDPRPAQGNAVAPGPPSADPVPLETQVEALRAAGLPLAPGRTIDDLLMSWSREEFESDPYNLLLVMYGSEVEAEPWGRVFCERGWNFDMECLAQAGDYARAFAPVLRTTGRPGLVKDLSDDFHIDAEAVEIRYTLQGQPRRLTARVDNDWADPEAVTAFLRDVEIAVGDDRRFWAADNGQASVLLFITEAEAAAIDGLRPGLLMRYVET